MASIDGGPADAAAGRRRFLACAGLIPLALAACRFPRDPENTLETVSGGTMRVGALESAPWVVWQGEAPAGVEVDLIGRFAATLSARPAWYARRDGDIHRSLAEGELDLLIGNLVADDPWTQHLAFTRPYLEIPVLVFAPDGGTLATIGDTEVAVPPASPLAALVEDAGGRPVPGGDPATMAAARPAWTRGPGETGDALMLETQRHVMAVRKGENAWLLALERFLAEAGGPDLRRRLSEAAA